jgi:hypothetical protein
VNVVAFFAEGKHDGVVHGGGGEGAGDEN